MRGGPALEGLEHTLSHMREIMLKKCKHEATSAALEFSPRHLENAAKRVQKLQKIQCRNILEKNLGENEAERKIFHSAHGSFTGHLFFPRFQDVKFL